MHDDPRLTPLVASLPASVPFVSPETMERDRGRPFAARIGANENGFGASPQVDDAIRAAAGEMWKYSDAGSHDLRHALAAHHQIDAAHITIGEGIDGLLGTLVRMLVAPGTPVVMSKGAYPTFAYHVAGFGGALHSVPYRADHENLDALAAKAHEVGARLVYLANPDNPMGTWHKADAVAAFARALPEDSLLILDEAYIDMAPADAALPFDPDQTRMIRMRTFSKAYGLAGLRVGYAVGPQALISAFGRVCNHFGVNRMAQVAALAALKDQAHLKTTLARIDAARARIDQIAYDNGLSTVPSAANFVALDCWRDGAFARAVLDRLLAHDVFVRMPGVAPLDRCIRVSCAPEAELDLFARALPLALREAD